MKRKHRLFSGVLAGFLLLGVIPATGFGAEASPEIWPGYPGVDQLPAIDTIPDPFKFFDAKDDPSGDGYVSSPDEWTARRDEIKDLVQHYWLGYRWPTQPESVVGATYVADEPNTISLGFDFPPYFTSTKLNLKDEFDKLSANLLERTVEIRELVPASNPFGAPTLGDVKYTLGPAGDEEDAEALAIEAWNDGYYVAYSSFGAPSYAVLKDYTGPLSAPPATTKPVTYNTITVTNPDSGAEASFNVRVNMPTPEQIAANWGASDAKVPVVIDIGGAISQIGTLNEQGYGDIQFTPTDIYPDDSNANDGINRDGVYTKLYPYDKDVYEYASGALMAWSWAASQIVSALEQPAKNSDETWGDQLGIDPTKSLVTGHSRYGKSALFAGAFDDRISIVFPSESGGSGIQSYRYKVEGKIFGFNTSTYPEADRVYGKTEIPTVTYGQGTSWMPENAAAFLNKDNRFPFDADDIIALVAPRPFIATTGIHMHWLGNEGSVASVQAASEVYKYIGKDNAEQTNIAMLARQSNHAVYNRDLPFIIAIMDREFKQLGDTTLHVKDLFPTGDGSLNSMSYPAHDYNGISDFNSYPFDVNSSYLPWSGPNEYTLWTAQETFLVGHEVTIAAHSDAPDAKLYLPNGTEIAAVAHNGEQFTFRLTADQAQYGRYELRSVGSDKENKSVFFSAISLSDALRHATSKGDEGEENRLIGFGSRLTNNEADPPEVYIDGKRTSMNFTPSRFVNEETGLLEYGVLFHDSLFTRIANEGWDPSKTFDIRNLKFVAIPGYTFEVSFGNIYASANNSGKDGAAQFTQPISWNVERYNNGPASDNWPVIPDTKAEKDVLAEGGGTVARPEAPAPKATAFNAQIVGTKVQSNGDKTDVIIEFDTALDTREFGFGFDVADKWDTTWSDDGKQVTLALDKDKFPAGTDANLIIFRLKDTDGNMIPGPLSLSLVLPGPVPSNPGPTTPSTIDSTPIVSTNGELALPAGRPGQVSLGDEVTIDIPADATVKQLQISIRKVTDTQELLTDDEVLASPVYDIVNNPAGNFNKPVKLTFAFDPSSLTGDRQPAVYSYDETNKTWVRVDGGVIVGNRIAVEVDHVAKFAVLAVEPDDDQPSNGEPGMPTAFSDIDGHWASAGIRQAVSLGIVKGYPDGTFKPNAAVTRAEFTVMLMQALKPQQNGEELTFADAAAIKAWARQAVAQAVQAGLVTGYEDGTFRPDDDITRVEMAAVLAKALKLVPEADAGTGYADDREIPAWAKGTVAAVQEAGLIVGKNGNTFDPVGKTTRAEAVTVLLRMLQQQ
ncbi:S-layer homology domain-containing protein [Cohnella fermenti]|nr:S-layer homology domain-containing protein [Cohnella fermenti]